MSTAYTSHTPSFLSNRSNFSNGFITALKIHNPFEEGTIKKYYFAKLQKYIYATFFALYDCVKH
jgi:hypothetical protein